MNRKLLKDAAAEYLALGLNPLPLYFNHPQRDDKTKRTGDKKPTLVTWKHLESELMSPETLRIEFGKHEAQGVGIVTGAISGYLEVIDVDTKHDKEGTLWAEFSDLIREHFGEKAEEFLLVQTRTGGYHIYYRCEEYFTRPRDPEDREDRIKKNPWFAKDGTTKEVLIEMRTEGGYIVAPPSPGYTVIQGSYDSIPTLTEAERELLVGLARRFNTYFPKVIEYKARTPKKQTGSGLAPWEDYDERGDVIGLLQRHGWTVTGRSGSRVFVLRPGNTSSNTSGDFHEEFRLLKLWSTSTIFESEKGYRPSAVYAMLECGGDFSEAARRLRAEGFGDSYGNERGSSMSQQYTSIPVPVSISTDGLRVDVQTRTGETLTLTETLTADTLRELKADKARLYFTEDTDREQLTDAAKLLLGNEWLSVFVSKVQDLDTLEGHSEQSEEHGVTFLYDTIRSRYEGKKGLTAEEEDSLLRELVEASRSLKGLKIDKYINLFRTDTELHTELGISPEAWEKTVEALRREQRAKEREADLRSLTLQLQDLTEKGHTRKAIETLSDGLQELRRAEGSELVPVSKDWATIRRELEQTASGLSTGYPELDKFVSFKPGALTLVGGRPSNGKTALLLNFCLNIAQEARKEGSSVYFFTYEEPSNNLAIKLLNIINGKDLTQPGGSLTTYELLKYYVPRPGEQSSAFKREIAEAEEIIRELIDSRTIVLVDAHSYTAEQLGELITHQAKERNIRAVLVDYVQRMRTDTKTQDKRTQIGHISDVLLRTAIDTDLPFLVGAQMNRDAAGKKPSLENLKEAGNLEEDANTVLSVFNPHREEPDPTERAKLSKLPKVNVEVAALKNREGEVNRYTELTLEKYTQRITPIQAAREASEFQG